MLLRGGPLRWLKRSFEEVMSRVDQSRDKTFSFHCSEVQIESKLKFILAPCSFEKSISENFDFLEMDDNLSEPLSHVVFC